VTSAPGLCGGVAVAERWCPRANRRPSCRALGWRAAVGLCAVHRRRWRDRQWQD